MTQNAVPAVGSTANDRMKQSWDNLFWGSMIVAIVAHFGIFQLSPDMTAADVSFTSDVLEALAAHKEYVGVVVVEAIDIPPEIEIPPPPEAIQRPATPVISEAEID